MSRRCTVLLLDDDSAAMETHLESLAHGVITLERRAPIYGGTRRRLEVVKLRGVKYRDGFHDYSIETGGLHVYPRLVAADHRVPFDHVTIASGVPELDLLLGGGLDSGTATLVIGPAGSGKSAFAAQYAVAAALERKPATMFVFDESLTTAVTRGTALGLPMKELRDQGRLRLTQVDPAEMSPGQFAHEVRKAVEKGGSRLIVIDSLTGYMNSMPEEQFLLNQLHELLSYLGQQGVVTIMVATQHGLIGSMESRVDVSYLADSVVMLRFFEAAGSVRNAISVVKKRTGKHEKTLREYKLGKSGIHISGPLVEFQGVLSGTPNYIGADSPLLGEVGV
jgi:circadian clock protein KaiC